MIGNRSNIQRVSEMTYKNGRPDDMALSAKHYKVLISSHSPTLVTLKYLVADILEKEKNTKIQTILFCFIVDLFTFISVSCQSFFP